MGKRVLFGVLLGVMAGSSWATQDYFDAFLSSYKLDAKSKLGSKECAVCHVSVDDYEFNPYGKTVKEKGGTPGPELFASIEADDSDGDGTPNGEEIKSGEGMPGDPAVGGKAGVAPPPAKEEEKENPLWPKNAWHPAVVHFPIGLFMAGLLLDFLGLVRKDKTLLTAGWYNIVLASLTSFGAVLTGFLAMNAMGFPLRGTMNDHMMLTIGATVMMAMMVFMRLHRHEKMNLGLRILYYVLATACLLTLSWAGHLGGIVAGTA